MELEVIGVYDRGNLNFERIHLLVTSNCYIGKYILTDSTYLKDGTVSNKLRHLYWFPDLEVYKNQSIILYTREGIPHYSEDVYGNIVHNLFWELNRTVWNKEGDCAILCELNNWKSTVINPYYESKAKEVLKLFKRI